MSEDIRKVVKEKYASVARSGLSSDLADVKAVAEAFGYSPEQLASIPAEANTGVSCGNPTATASLKPGEVVVDLGCGGGLDVFLAAQKVKPEGKAIGIDMTPDMLKLARRNAEKAGHSNVEFHEATIDNLPIPDGTVDCVISNCVINLAPDKKAVFREIVRVLKPGGRLAVSDIALKKPLPPEIRDDVIAFVGCISGAISTIDYRQWLLEAGFEEVEVVDSDADLNAYAMVASDSEGCSLDDSAEPSAVSTSCCGPTKSDGGLHAKMADVLQRYDINSYAASVRIFAVKPKS